MPVITAAAVAVADTPATPSVAKAKAVTKMKAASKATSRVKVQKRPTRVAAHRH